MIRFRAQLTEVLGRMQKFEALEPVLPHQEVTWLSGIDFTPGVVVGDVGVLEYRTTPNRGYYAFVKDTA